MVRILCKDAAVKNPTVYLFSVVEVENCTGINFFPELEPSVEREVEAFVPKRMREIGYYKPTQKYLLRRRMAHPRPTNPR